VHTSEQWTYCSGGTEVETKVPRSGAPRLAGPPSPLVVWQWVCAPRVTGEKGITYGSVFFFEGRQKAFARFLLDEGKKKHTWACLQVRHREYQGQFHYAKNTTVCNGPGAHSPQGVQNDIFKVCF